MGFKHRFKGMTIDEVRALAKEENQIAGYLDQDETMPVREWQLQPDERVPWDLIRSGEHPVEPTDQGFRVYIQAEWHVFGLGGYAFREAERRRKVSDAMKEKRRQHWRRKKADKTA